MRRGRGYILADMAATASVLGMAMTAALSLYTIAAKANLVSEKTLVATNLAAELLEEVRLRKFDEKRLNKASWLQTAPSAALGPDAGEPAADKKTFDDVDDFHGWSEKPPQDPVGRVVPGLSGFQRTVQVAYVTASLAPSAVPTDFKLVTVCATGRAAKSCLPWLATNR